MHPGDPSIDVSWFGDRAVRVRLGEGDDDATHGRVLAAWRALRDARLPGVADLTPASTTVLVTLAEGVGDPAAVERVERAVRAVVSGAHPGAEPPGPSRLVEMPVCYDGDCGPDLDEVAARAGLTREEAVRLHAGATYTVRFLGFTPGFPYLAGLPERLAMPRLASPRTRVPAGSVGIADALCGIYPAATPGGWRLIGRTGARLFDASRDPAALLAPGDRVRFVRVPREAIGAPGGTT